MKLTLESHNQEGIQELVKLAQKINDHVLAITGKITVKFELSEDEKKRMHVIKGK